MAKCAFYWHLCSTFIICGMEQDQLLLSWDDFEKMTQASFRDLLGETEFTDVTLATDDDKQIRAHKVIISSCSSFFKNILSKYPGKNPILYLKDIKYEALQKLLIFMYVGQCEIEQSELDMFLSTAKSLKIKGLDGLEGSLEAKPTKIQSNFQKTPRKEEHISSKNEISDDRFKCKPCGIGFAKSWDLGIHHDKEHTENKGKKQTILIEAEVAEEEKQTFQTNTIIDNDTRASTNMSQDILNKISLGNKCRICEKDFDKFTLLLPHYCRHFSKSLSRLQRKYFTDNKCNFCSKVVKSRKSRVIHIGLQHEAVLPFLLPYIRPNESELFRSSTNMSASEDFLPQTKSKLSQQPTQGYQEMITQTTYLGITKTCHVCCAESQTLKRAVKHLINKHFNVEMASLESAYFVKHTCIKCNFIAIKNRTKHNHMGLEHGEIYSLLKK